MKRGRRCVSLPLFRKLGILPLEYLFVFNVFKTSGKFGATTEQAN